MNPSIVKRCLVGAVLAIAATLPGFQQLHTSVEGLKLIADYEGCRLQPYQCSAGGSSYEPRRVTARSKKGRIKRQMFAKLRTTKYLKTAASADSASVQFEGKVQRIARVHHYGLRDRVSRKGPEVRYAERRLLGGNDEVETRTRNILVRWLIS